MSWFFRAESSLERSVDDEDGAAFRDALEGLLSTTPNETTIHIRGPLSEILKRAIADTRNTHERHFKAAWHPPRVAAAGPPPSPDLKRQLADIHWRASLAEAYGGRHRVELKELVAAFRHRFPDEGTRLKHALDDGEELGKGRRELHRALDRKGSDSQLVQDLLRHLFKRWPAARKTLNKIVDRALAAEGHPILGPTKLEHRVWRLKPEAAWHVYIDETGSGFEAKDGGALWAVLVPEPLLAVIPRPSATFHAVSEPATVIDRALSDLLAHPVGLIGVEARAFAPIADPSRRWLAGVTELIDWIIRLVPTNPEGRTLVHIHVEQRGAHSAGEEWEALPTALLAQLSRYMPARANRLDIERIQVEGKSAEGAWADVIAHTWGGTSQDADARRRILDLDRFMVGPDGYDLRRLVDLGLGQADPPIATWRRVINASQRYGRDHVIHEVLGRLGRVAHERPDLWRRLLDATLAALHAADADIAALGHEVSWLDRALPADTALRPKAHLAWSLAVLAEENHTGDATGGDLFATVSALADLLFDEDPTLVGLADLHVAVAHTNRFEFDTASSALQRWQGLPLGVGGIKLHAMVLSSLGQHAAFRAEHARAEACFADALALLDRLSDPDERAPELERTRIYRAINAIDALRLPDAEVHARVTEALGMDPADAAAGLSGPTSPQRDRFRLHLVCRYAVSGRASATPTREAVAAATRVPEAVPNAAFPWGLVWTYRALILEAAGEVEAAARATTHARAIASTWLDAGPTLAFIGLTLEAALLPAGDGLHPEDRDATVALLRRALPAASARIARVDAWAARAGNDPLDLLKATLPFNFR